MAASNRADEPFKLSIVTNYDVEYNLPQKSLLLSVEGYSVSFRPPSKWSVAPEKESKSVVIRSPDAPAGISLRFIPRKPDSGPAAAPQDTKAWLDSLRSRAQSLCPEQTLRNEQINYAAGIPGAVYTFTLTRTNRTVLSTRIGLFENQLGQIEISLRASGELNRYHGTWNALLNSITVKKAPANAAGVTD